MKRSLWRFQPWPRAQGQLCPPQDSVWGVGRRRDQERPQAWLQWSEGIRQLLPESRLTQGTRSLGSVGEIQFPRGCGRKGTSPPHHPSTPSQLTLCLLESFCLQSHAVGAVGGPAYCNSGVLAFLFPFGIASHFTLSQLCQRPLSRKLRLIRGCVTIAS